MKTITLRVSAFVFAVCLSGIVGCGSAGGGCGGTDIDGPNPGSRAASMTCGRGTVLSGTQCVPADSVLQCGTGTVRSGNTCVAAP